MVKALCMLAFAAAVAGTGRNMSTWNQAVTIRNNCDRSLVITNADGGETLGTLQPGQTMDQHPSGSSGRYQAYWTAAEVGKTASYGLFEYTVCGDRLCCNPSHVDVMTIPVTLACSNGERTGCTNNPSMAEVRSAIQSCPTARSEYGSVSNSESCYSLGYACSVHPDAPYCGHASEAPMQRAMRRWGGADSARNVYACAGTFAEDSPGCSKLNRGVSDPASDPSNYYKATEDGVPLYNEFCKWLHDLCGVNDYCFPYDDNANHGGYMECPGAVTVDFCSGNNPPSPPYTPTPPPPTPTPTPTPTPGGWAPCSAGACCNPHSAVPQYCPGTIPCQECGGGDACQCPGGLEESIFV